MRMRTVTVCSALVAMVPLVTTACVLPASSSTEPAQGVESPARQHVPGEVIIQFRAGTSKERIHEVIAAAGASVEKNLGTPLAYLVRFSNVRPIDELLARLRGYPEVLHAEANRVIRIEPPRPMPGTKPAPVEK